MYVGWILSEFVPAPCNVLMYVRIYVVIHVCMYVYMYITAHNVLYYHYQVDESSAYEFRKVSTAVNSTLT